MDKSEIKKNSMKATKHPSELENAYKVQNTTIIVDKEQFAKSEHHMRATLCGRMPKFKDLGKETSEP